MCPEPAASSHGLLHCCCQPAKPPCGSLLGVVDPQEVAEGCLVPLGTRNIWEGGLSRGVTAMAGIPTAQRKPLFLINAPRPYKNKLLPF